MSIQNFFKFLRRQPVSPPKGPVKKSKNDIPEIPRMQDYLGKAAQAKHRGKDAVKRKDYDKAWSEFHKQKDYYLRHAKASGFTRAQTLALDATISEDFANVLRIEGKHDQAFVHILYWASCSKNLIKRQEKKLTSYFARCKFCKTKYGDVERFLKESRKSPDFIAIQKMVSKWATCG